MSTTPIASAHVCTQKAPSGHASTEAINLRPLGQLRPMEQHEEHLTDMRGKIMVTLYRHTGLFLPERLGRWHGYEYRTDKLGREWSRSFFAVTDDFGWLVEVPA